MEIPKVVMQMQMFNQIINYTVSICRVQINYEGSSLSGRVGKFYTLNPITKKLFSSFYFDNFHFPF